MKTGNAFHRDGGVDFRRNFELRATTLSLVDSKACHHHRLRRRLRRRRRDSCRCRFEDRIEEGNQQLTITVVSVLRYQKAAP